MQDCKKYHCAHMRYQGTMDLCGYNTCVNQGAKYKCDKALMNL